MLKKILIGVAVVLIIGLGVAGYEIYNFYNAANKLIIPQIQLNGCSNQLPAGYAGLPKLLPWTNVSATVKTTPTPLPTSAGGSKLSVCGNSPSQEPTLSGTKRINILVLGTDNDCKNIGLLSQTIFVVTIDPVHHKVGMLSIPRDSWVPIPGSTPGDPYTYHKIDEAMSYGSQASGSLNPETQFQSGVKYAEETVEANFGISINHFAWVGLAGFEKVINTLHGVDVNALHPIVDDYYPGDVLHAGTGCNGYSRVYIPAGPQYMNGSIALQYVRSRHADLNGDYGRGARQLQTMVALRPKIGSLGLTDFLTVQSILSDLKGSVKTDIPLDQIGGMVNFAKSLDISKIHKVVLSPPYYSEPGMSPDGSQSVVYLNWAHVLPKVNKMFAPIKLGSGRHHHGPKYVTAAQAAAYLLRISGATAQPPPVVVRNFNGHVSGSIYYVDHGNVWRFDSSGSHQVTHTTAINSADITSNGHKLVYYRRWQQSYADVWLKDMTSGKTTQLTQSRLGDGNLANSANCGDYPQCAYVWNVSPAISSNGHTIVYSSDAYKDVYAPALTVNPDCYFGTAPNVGGAIDPALYTYDVAGGVAAQASAPCDGAGGDADARFNPSNPNQLVYTEFYYLRNSTVASRLVVLNVADQSRHRITPFVGNNMQGAWSPNGRRMAWLGSSTQSTTLYEAAYTHGRLKLGGKRVLDTGLISEPEFAPDGKHLVYFKLVGSSFQVWIVDLKNGWAVGQPMPLFKQSDLTTTSPLVWIK